LQLLPGREEVAVRTGHVINVDIDHAVGRNMGRDDGR
jgi:hypothetical protein